MIWGDSYTLLLILGSIFVLSFAAGIIKKNKKKQNNTKPVQNIEPTFTSPSVPVQNAEPTFTSQPVKTQEVIISQICKGCGANNKVVIGKANQCDYCGMPLNAGNAPVTASVQAGNNDIHSQFIAATVAQNPDLAKQLLNNGADINAIDKLGETALMKAVFNRNADMVTFLLNNGANTKIVNKTGRTALMQAINRNRTDMVKLLRDHGVEK